MKNKIYAVSSCLVGLNVKYNGKNNYNDRVIKFLKDKKYITICPEVLGGMSIPRIPSEIINNKVINKNNIDVSDYFIKGAKKAIELCIKNKVTTIIAKSNSPSCGYLKIYDGTFTSTLISGNGIFIKLAIENGFEILTENDIKNALESKL